MAAETPYKIPEKAIQQFKTAQFPRGKEVTIEFGDEKGFGRRSYIQVEHTARGEKGGKITINIIAPNSSMRLALETYGDGQSTASSMQRAVDEARRRALQFLNAMKVK